jgi:hypothetical protein
VLSAAALLALSARLQADVGCVLDQAAATGARVATFSLNADVKFRDALQRAEFANALRDSIADLIGRFTDPAADPGRPFRLVLGCYPIPKEEPK